MTLSNDVSTINIVLVIIIIITNRLLFCLRLKRPFLNFHLDEVCRERSDPFRLDKNAVSVSYFLANVRAYFSRSCHWNAVASENIA